MTTLSAETEKYAEIWEHPDYAKWSPGEQFVDLFLELAGDERGSLIDLGCGSGKASVKLRDKGFAVTGFDLVDARLDRSIPFVQGCLWDRPAGDPFAVGYCTDVLEHVPTEYVMLTLLRISQRCARCFFSISNLPDHFGQVIGQRLHLTVRPFAWWKRRIEEAGGKILHGRDLMTDSLFWVAFDE